MTRSILCGLLGLISVVTIGTLPVACQSGGVGDPCTPEDEYNPDFAGFKVTEENIESRSFQCSTRICLVNHFQGRVSCPLGQDPLDTGVRKSCSNLKDKSCPTGQNCVAAATLAPDCSIKNDPVCPMGTACDTNKRLCLCSQDVAINGTNYVCGTDKILTSYACHAAGNCQTAGAAAKDNSDKSGNPKDCCVPGTDTPVVSSVCSQCATKSNRDAAQAVYCSCRCGTADGAPAEPDFNFCTCPTGFTCTQIRRDVGLGDVQITGKYCIKEGSAYSGDAFSCGEVQGHFDSTCLGSAPLSKPPGT